MPVGREKIYDTLRAATFGLISAVLLGGPLARTLIVKNNLKPNEDEEFAVDVSDINASTGEKLSGLDIIKNITVILGCAALNLKSGIQGAWLNVCININGMSDQAFADEYRAKGQAILDKALPMADAAYAVPGPVPEGRECRGRDPLLVRLWPHPFGRGLVRLIHSQKIQTFYFPLDKTAITL